MSTINKLNAIRNLQNDWDGEGSPAPSNNVMWSAHRLIGTVKDLGSQIYNVVPGPKGEIMVDVQGKNLRSVEFIIYPDKIKYVKFPETDTPEQGLFGYYMLPGLLAWVNQ